MPAEIEINKDFDYSLMSANERKKKEKELLNILNRVSTDCAAQSCAGRR